MGARCRGDGPPREEHGETVPKRSSAPPGLSPTAAGIPEPGEAIPGRELGLNR